MAACRVLDEPFRMILFDGESEGDTHGNMLATLARSGSSSYTAGNWQSYDVWGGVRSGSSTEDQGYVANLGHRTDSESSLTYMRARYYEPHTGRFLSEDPALDGTNWFVYCGNAPTHYVDPTGEDIWPYIQQFNQLLDEALSLYKSSYSKMQKLDKLRKIIDKIEEIARWERLTSGQTISQTALRAQTNGLYGQFGVIKTRLDYMKIAVSTFGLGHSTAAQLSVHILKILYQMIVDGL